MTEDFRKQIIFDLEQLGKEYIEHVLHNEGYYKSIVHWKMTELLCSYIRKKPYDKEISDPLYMKIHNETQEITNNMENSINLPMEKLLRNWSNIKIMRYSVQLVEKMIDITTKLDINETEEIIPTQLNPPIRKLIEVNEYI